MKRKPMELVRLRPMTHSMAVGAVFGAAIVVGLVTWRTIATDSVRDSLLGFGIAVVAMGALFTALMLWQLKRTLRKLERELPGGAKVEGQRRGLQWFAVLAGVGAALGGAKSSWNEPVWGAVAAGCVVGILIGLIAFYRRMAAWEEEHDQELLRGQQGVHTRFFVRDEPGDRELVKE